MRILYDVFSPAGILRRVPLPDPSCVPIGTRAVPRNWPGPAYVCVHAETGRDWAPADLCPRGLAPSCPVCGQGMWREVTTTGFCGWLCPCGESIADHQLRALLHP